MPGMPFHLEKGHAFMALEDVINDSTHHAIVAAAWDGLRTGTPVGQVFDTALQSAPVLSHFAGKAGQGGLGPFVTHHWFGTGKPKGTAPYWLDYRGDVDGIVREALLFAMETAWGVSRDAPLPANVDRGRQIRLLWHCAQRWFDAWILWDSPTDDVTVLFATPPHTGGDIIDRIKLAIAKGWANEVSAASASTDGDMVLVCQERNTRGRRKLRSPLVPSPRGAFTLPAIGRDTVGSGGVGTYSIHADAGGAQPPTSWQ